ncbi:unnamed protein product [Dicrocoelium dendriticum]|nr:unnamed protein product [Dicrocoelium dendriticum]
MVTTQDISLSKGKVRNFFGINLVKDNFLSTTGKGSGRFEHCAHNGSEGYEDLPATGAQDCLLNSNFEQPWHDVCPSVLRLPGC